jgi:hypothetical protein
VSGTAATAAAPQQVTLTGCLQGATHVGTAATGTMASATGGVSGTAGAGADTHAGRASADRLTLVDARPVAGEAGVGASGAGASGGPLVSARSSYVLDGIPGDARAYLNKQVRIVGRIDAAPAVTAPPGDAAGGIGSSGTDNRTTNAAAPRTGTTLDPRRLAVESVEVVAQNCSR